MKPFDVYKELENIEAKELKLRENRNSNNISGYDDIYNFYKSEFFNAVDKFTLPGTNTTCCNDLYDFLLGGVDGLIYNFKDIEKLSKSLEPFHASDGFLLTGLYISALVNSVARSGQKLELDFSNLNCKSFVEYMVFLGYGLDRNIEMTINGYIGGWVGDHMKNGSIIVRGNVTGNCVGYEMQGGSIELFGNSGEHLGCKMNGGRIILHQSNYHLSNEKQKGEIYLNDERIFSK